MERPNYWIVNPFHENYDTIPKKTTCIYCEGLAKNDNKKKHKINTILNNESEKRYQYNLKTKLLSNKWII
jgi:hypothetical protein